MYYCPRCRATISADAQVCGRCGLTRFDAQRISALPIVPVAPVAPPPYVERPPLPHPITGTSQLPPNTPEIVQAIPPVPTRSLQPHSKRVPARPNSGPFPVPSAQPRVQTPLPKPSQQFMRPPSLPGIIAPLPAQQQPQPLMSPSQSQILAFVDTPTSQLPIEVVKGRPPLLEPNEQFTEDDEGAESYIATSLAAEHWRTSWRNRQRSEAGPASMVSRGQSLVPEPLMAMQNSLVRMRAILLPKKARFDARFWILLLLMLTLLGGLIAFIGATFQTKADTASQSIPSSTLALPSLSIQGTAQATVRQGQFLHLYGENFNIGAPIIFLLDGTLPINGTDGRELSVLVSDQGTFAVAIPVTSDWSAGPHVIRAYDNQNGQLAYLNIDVTLAGAAATTNPNLSLSTNLVTFHAVVGQGEPQEQFITLTNTNATKAIQWAASAETADNLTWLDLDETTSSGRLSIGGTGTIGISAMVDGLTASSKVYSGNIVITINQNEQLTLPVALQLTNTNPEIAINPNPVIGILANTGDSCQANSTLLLANISNQPVSWSLNMDSTTASHIAFVYRGTPTQNGTLAPAGQQNDSTILSLQCLHVKNGTTYHCTITTGTVAWPVTVTIQATP